MLYDNIDINQPKDPIPVGVLGHVLYIKYVDWVVNLLISMVVDVRSLNLMPSPFNSATAKYKALNSSIILKINKRVNFA